MCKFCRKHKKEGDLRLSRWQTKQRGMMILGWKKYQGKIHKRLRGRRGVYNSTTNIINIVQIGFCQKCIA